MDVTICIPLLIFPNKDNVKQKRSTSELYQHAVKCRTGTEDIAYQIHLLSKIYLKICHKQYYKVLVSMKCNVESFPSLAVSKKCLMFVDGFHQYPVGKCDVIST